MTKTETQIAELLGYQPESVRITVTIEHRNYANVMTLELVNLIKKSLGYKKNRQARNTNILTAFCYVLKEKGYKLKSTGRLLGIDHTTVIHHHKRYLNFKDTNDDYLANIEYFIDTIRRRTA